MTSSGQRTYQAPLWRVAWRRVRRRPLQYLLLILGVALGVAMMVSVDVANESSRRAFQLSTDAVAGRATHRLVGGPSGIDETFYTRLRTTVGHLSAAPIVEGYVLGRGLDGQPLRLVGVDPFAEAPFRNYFAIGREGMGEGIIPFLTHPHAIVMSRDLAEEYDLFLGESTIFERGGWEIRATLIGMLAPADDVSRQAIRNIVFCDIATAQELLEMHGRLSHIDLIVSDSADLAAIKAIMPADVYIETAAARGSTLQQMTAAFELNLSAMSLLALMVGMFLIYNTVTFSVVQRRALFGTLRCLGVTGGQLFALILFESALFGMAGALIGLGVGIFLGWLMVGLVAQTINDLYFVLNVHSLSISAMTLAKGLLAGVGAAVISSLPPALEAMRTSPQANLSRSSLESRSRRALPWFTLSGTIFIVSGVILLWLSGNNLVAAFVGLFLLLFGMALLAPAIVIVLMSALSPVIGMFTGVIGRMAPRNIVRSLSRTSVAIAALMVAISVIVGVSIMIGSFRGSVSQWLESTFKADIYISPPVLAGGQAGDARDALAPDVVALAKNWPGVRRVVTARNVTVMAPQWGRPVEVISVDGDISDGNRDYLWKSSQQRESSQDRLWDRLEAGEGVMISQPLFNRENMSIPPDPIMLMTPEGPIHFPVLAVYYDYASDQGTVMIGQDLFRRKWEDDRITSVALFLGSDQDIEKELAALRKAVYGRQDVIIQSNRSLRKNALEVFDRTFVITAALQLLATVVAFIGVLSALMSLLLERSRELGILRAAGMSLGQMWRLTFLETGLMGGAAGLLAMPAGWVLAWVLIYVINLRSFGWTMTMVHEPAYFLNAFLIAVTAALLAGIYPALRLGRINITSAIRQE